MAQRIIHLDEEALKGIIREVLNEIDRSEFESYEGDMYNVPHTDRSIEVGDVVAIHSSRNALDSDGNLILYPNGRPKQIGGMYFNTVVGKKNGMLVLDNGKSISPQSVKCTDVWYTILKSMGMETSRGISIDFENIDGELWVIVDYRPDLNQHTRTRYRYDDVKNSKPGERLKSVKMETTTELLNTGFWLKEGKIVPDRSKNPMPGSKPVQKEFICMKVFMGKTASAEMFEAWNYEKWEDICNEFPWMGVKPASWALPKMQKGDNRYTDPRKKKNNVTPEQYGEWLEHQSN